MAGMSTTNRILHGDCRQTLRTLADCSVDSIVTDPPYGLEFMGKDWDAPWKGKAKTEFNHIEPGTFGGFTSLPNHSRVNNVKCAACDRWKFSSSPCVCDAPKFPNARRDAMVEFQLWFQQVADECLRVLKPGGHLLAFGGTRTYHRMAVAIEDAGFEVRDSIHWLYGSGFPKSLDVSKAIDKAAGAEREVLGRGQNYGVSTASDGKQAYGDYAGEWDITAPATDAAKQWDGWGTALKPAHEPIVVARKPLVGTVAQNVLQHGTGALNIDGGRVGTSDVLGRAKGGWLKGGYVGGESPQWDSRGTTVEGGRWPANLVLTHAADCADTCAAGCPVAELDRQSGTLTSGANPTRRGPDNARNTFGGYAGQTDAAPARGIDTGGASRFFTVTEWDPITDVPFRYVAKPGKTERNAGLDGLPEKPGGTLSGGEYVSPGRTAIKNGTAPRANHHPTVKPVDLMRWLVRLITPPGGTVLDPFLGSGTTAVAAILEGFNWVGCELTDDYLPIIEGRVAWAQHRVGYVAPTRVTSSEPDQLELFS
jgi:DNA modification methylase